ncbi:DUF6283 family protein [Amycolatopsis sp., V23-08]|uniref:DUF6283 family protein n=1 Tax=Amycolatopsis heterodermiae TaxID=3110235 RepID=A0ABU5RLS2_9PSEU|nr:DUF6283 family protein [Amycolatopsis sp., V23-08]MEA5367245.1 DUF6283 family protein [Amycolatopsis sp., V23-08]
MPDPTDETSTPAADAEIVAVNPGADGWGVITYMAPGSAYQATPCTRCPWLRDSPTGAFPPEVFQHSAHTTYDLATHKFGCHASPRDEPKTCAGFLLRGSAHNLAVRVYGPDVPTAVSTYRPLYDNYREMAIANGVAPDDPALTPCRDSRPYLGPSDTTPAKDASMSTDTVISRAAQVIREFIVDSAGMDLGEPMTSQADLLAGRLAATGQLDIPAHERYSGSDTTTSIIRAFIVDAVGNDNGDDTTAHADELRHHLAAAGVLASGVHEPLNISSIR